MFAPVDFRLQLADLFFEAIVFVHLILKKVVCYPCFFLYAAGCQEIEVGGFIVGVLEVVGLDKSLVNQGFEKKINFPQAYAETTGQFSLGHLGILLYLPKDLENLFLFGLE